MRRLAILTGLAGCVAQDDPIVFVALPDVPVACATLDAARLAVDVSTLQGERFTVESSACRPQLAGQDIPGFELQLARLGPGFQRIDARLERSNGDPLGGLARPFEASELLVIELGRADLPGWPRAALVLDLPGCADPTATVHVEATAANEARAVAVADLSCSAPSVDVPRGQTTLVARVTASDGSCTAAAIDTFVFDDAVVSLVPTGSCP